MMALKGGGVKFQEIVSRVTGLSCPVFGVSWNPPEAEVVKARRVIAFLEDRRVLYVPSEMERPDLCVRSVCEIRGFLTEEIGRASVDSDLTQSLRAMRGACRKFLNALGPEDSEVARFGAHPGHWASWEFNGALGELRGVVGLHVARIAAEYGLGVENNLARILPEADQ
jgi:hypothetical protein